MNLKIELKKRLKILFNSLYSSITYRFYLFSTLIIVIFLSILYVQYRYAKSINYRNAKTQSQLVSDNIYKEIINWLNFNSVYIQNISKIIRNNNFDDNDKLKIMKSLLQDNQFFSSIYYGDENNKMLNASGWVPPSNFDLRQRPWYKMAVESDGLIYTNLFLNASKDDIIITIAKSFYLNNTKAVVAGDVSVKTLLQKIVDMRPSENGFVVLLDAENNIIAHPDYYDNKLLTIDYQKEAYTNLLSNLKNKKISFTNVLLENTSGYVVFRPIEKVNWFIICFIPEQDLFVLMTRFMYVFIFLIMLTFIVMVCFFVIEHNHIIKPVNILKEKILKLDFEKDMNNRINYEADDEFSVLADTFNFILDKAKQFFDDKYAYQNKLVLSNKKLEQKNIQYEEINKELTNVNSELFESNNEKTILLSEIHDRVKNNLMLVQSMLTVQQHYLKDNKIIELFEDCKNRIYSMALVHENLYSASNYSKINIKQYIESIVSNIYNNRNIKNCKIKFDINCEDIVLTIKKAVPVGLIINEIISNSFNHAFENRHQGHIIVDFKNIQENNYKYKLSICDDGVGLNTDIDITGEMNTCGFKLVSLLNNQLNGTIEINSKNGFEFIINF